VWVLSENTTYCQTCTYHHFYNATLLKNCATAWELINGTIPRMHVASCTACSQAVGVLTGETPCRRVIMSLIKGFLTVSYYGGGGVKRKYRFLSHTHFRMFSQFLNLPYIEKTVSFIVYINTTYQPWLLEDVST
jgi:hypothetical protein